MTPIRSSDVPRLSELFRELLATEGHDGLKAIVGLAVAEFAARETRAVPAFRGRVVGCADGDTIYVRCPGGETKTVRLHAVDSPESGQEFGRHATCFAEVLLKGQCVTVHSLGKDKYGRIVGLVILHDGRVANYQLAAEGWAWWSAIHAPRDTALDALQAKARSESKGLWQQKRPTPPWTWRRCNSEGC